jgi:phage protein D
LFFTVTPEQVNHARERKEEHERNLSDRQNRHSKPDAKKLMEKAEKEAVEMVDKIYKAVPDQKTKANILKILAATKKAGASSQVMLNEVKALGAVERILANPPGASHHERDFFRARVAEVVAEGHKYVQANPSAVSPWRIIAERVAELERKHSRSLR